jgi:hypothetical protein
MLIHVSSGTHVESFPCHEIILQQKHDRMRNLAGFGIIADDPSLPQAKEDFIRSMDKNPDC